MSASASTIRTTPSSISPSVLDGFATRSGTRTRFARSNVYSHPRRASSKRSERLEHPGRPLLAASDLLGVHVVRDRLARVQSRHGGQRGRLAPARGVHGRRLHDHLQQRRPAVGHPAPADGSPQSIKADVGIYAQDRWTMGRATLNLGHALRLVPWARPARAKCCQTGTTRAQFEQVPRRQQRPGGRVRWQSPGLERHLAARRPRLRPVRRRAHGASRPASARYVAGQQIASRQRQ